MGFFFSVLGLAPSGCIFDSPGLYGTSSEVTVVDLPPLRDLADGAVDSRSEGAADGAKDSTDARKDSFSGDLGPALKVLNADDGRLWLGTSGTAKLELWSWDSASEAWSAEKNLPAVSGDVYWVINQVLPQGVQELAAVKSKTKAGDLSLQLLRWTGLLWTEDFSTISSYTSLFEKRDFDLALTAKSGQVMLVFGNGSIQPQYFLCSGTTACEGPYQVPVNDGSSGAGLDITDGTILWVQLVARPGTDELALLFADEYNDLGFIVWNGSNWDTTTAEKLTDSLKTNPNIPAAVSNRVFDGAYESKSGKLLVAWGKEASFGFYYKTRAPGSSFSSEASRAAPAAGIPHFVDLAGDPASNRIAGAFVDLGDGTERLGLATWNGSDWEGIGEYDSQIRDVNDTATGDFAGAVAWAGSSGTAVCVYPDDKSGEIHWYKWENTGNWKAGGPQKITGMGEVESVWLHGYANQGKLLAVISDSNSKIYTAACDGNKWTPGIVSPLSQNLFTLKAVTFSLSLKR